MTAIVKRARVLLGFFGKMAEFILKIDCRLVYEPGKSIEIHLKPEGSLPQEVFRPLSQAGKEISLALQYLSKIEQERSQKVRTKIKIE